MGATVPPSWRTYLLCSRAASKGIGAPDKFIDSLDEDDISGGYGTALDSIPTLNDEADSYSQFITKLRESKENFAVKRSLKYLRKRLKEWKQTQGT